MDIYCKNRKCMICGSKIDEVHPSIMFKSEIKIPCYCKNGCYEFNSYIIYKKVKSSKSYIVMGYRNKRFKIFDEFFDMTNLLSRKEKKKLKKEMIKKIMYWKEDYRYIAEILERN